MDPRIEHLGWCLIGANEEESITKLAIIGIGPGDFELNVAFRFGGTPYDVAE